MKKILIYILPLCLSLFSCEEFLTNKDKDKVIPNKAQHFKELVNGELIKGFSSHNFLPLVNTMSDDVTSFYNSSTSESRDNTFGYFAWQQDAELSRSKSKISDQNYSMLYKKILLCNSIEMLMEDVTDDINMCNQVYAELYFIRAYSYYLLANMYGTPYKDGTALCVPHNTATGSEQLIYRRATEKVIYDQITSDIEKAIGYFEKTTLSKSIYHPSLEATYILASRVYLVMREYDKVIEYADKLDYSAIYDLNEHQAPERETDLDTEYVSFFNKNNKEVVFTFGPNGIGFETSLNLGAGYTASEELMEKYSNGDLRNDLYIFSGKLQKLPIKLTNRFLGYYGINLRLSEALLNRAEAYFLKNEKEKAANDLNTLRVKRFTPDEYLPLSSGQLTIDEVRDEYRREFCFEGMRWFQLRNIGMPSLTHHFYTSNTEKETYVLEQGDKSYTLEIPRNVLDENPIIERINRPVRSSK